MAAYHGPAIASAPSPRALIVAVTTFEDPALAPFALAGAAHDARRMEHAFGKFAGLDGDAAGQATVLQGNEATLARTLTELARLGKEARPGERIMLYFSAHGTRIPDSGELDEPDGLDEVLLLADAGEWDGTRIPGGLLDDTLAAAVRVMRERGADVFLIIDSCAAGGASRSGGDTRRVRSLPPALLAVPDRPLRSARRDAVSWIEDDMPPGSGRLVVFAAAPTSAAAWDTPDGGLFTTTLAEALVSAPEDFVTLAQRQQRLQAALPLPGPPAELIGAVEAGFFFTGDVPDLVERAATLPRPGWSLDLSAAAQDDCFGGPSASPRPLDPAAVHTLAHCEAVTLAVASAQPGRFDAWYVDSAGQRTLLSPVSGLYLDGRTPAQLSYTFVARDPATGEPYPPGIERLLLLRRGPDGAHDAALTLAFAVGPQNQFDSSITSLPSGP